MPNWFTNGTIGWDCSSTSSTATNTAFLFFDGTATSTSTASTLALDEDATTDGTNQLDGYIRRYYWQQHRPGLFGMPHPEEAQEAPRPASSPLSPDRRGPEERALALLLSHLSGSQRRSYRRTRAFLVRGGATGRRYRIRGGGGLAGNIDVLDGEGDRVVHRLCAHAPVNLPMADHLLAQKLHIEHDERGFLEVANVHAAAF